jgi:catechol 2,3-dioxygenase-like lactoylglutathione lyase family enzyme
VIEVNEIAFVGYPVKDKQQARDFYEGVLGLTPTMNGDFPDGFWIEYEIASGTLALSNFWKPSGNSEQAGPTIGLEVEDLEETVAALKAKAVPFLMDTLETPVCHLAVIRDPDGNSLFIHKRKPGHS